MKRLTSILIATLKNIATGLLVVASLAVICITIMILDGAAGNEMSVLAWVAMMVVVTIIMLFLEKRDQKLSKRQDLD